MAYKIDKNTCIACAECVDVCPVEAIAESEGKYAIDADACLDCGICAGTCPQEAISQE